jgi:hypothetical protein
MSKCLQLFLAACFLAIRASGGVVDYPADGFSVAVPEGWRAIPAEVLADYSANISKLAGGKFNETYQYGYQRDYQGEWLIHPYMLIQNKQMGRVPERHLAQMKQFRKGVEQGLDKAAKAMDGVFSDMSLGETFYDPTNKCLWIQISAAANEGAKFRGISCGHLTEKGILFFHFYAKESEFDSLLPTFTQVAGSVKIREGLKYVSRATDARGLDFGRVGRSALIGALIGAGVGLCAWAMKRFGRKSPPPLPPAV